MASGLSASIAKALAKGRFSELKSHGLTRHNVNDILFRGGVLKVRNTNDTPFVTSISDPTPLVYAILWEQHETVYYLLSNLRASVTIAVAGVSLAFSGIQSTLQQPSETHAFCTVYFRRRRVR
jgi:hypothetical protein